MYNTKILLVLYRYETWYLTLREEHRFRVFGNRVPRRLNLRRVKLEKIA
jgi:hypothetical protein